MTTSEQAKQTIILLHWISKGFQPINVFRYDRKYQTVYIQAGDTDEIALIINSNGRWNFV